MTKLYRINKVISNPLCETCLTTIILNQLIPYKYPRSRSVLTKKLKPLIVDGTIRRRVVYSLVKPKKSILDFCKKAIKLTADEITELVVLLGDKILNKIKRNNIVLIAVLRSGLPLTQLLQYYYFKKYGLKIKAISLSPNYIERVYDKLLLTSMANKNSEFVFVDGWVSTGLTYKILQKSWKKISSNKPFHFAALSNLSNIKNRKIISSAKEDILIPWSISHTEYTELSNFFIDTISNESSAFIIKHSPIQKNNFSTYKSKIDNIVKVHDKKINNIYQRTSDYGGNKKRVVGASRKIKIGINECIKAIDKRDKITLYVGSKSRYKSLIIQYTNLNRLRHTIFVGDYVYIMKNITQ
ncbi:hypothetical protein HYW73_01160 [Candidatus Nomurabacteria bacterium]|nr:hypothetical protein [Candidatus Nomurabacteria bacterium]